MSPDFHNDISVQQDGVKLGWNIMATLAAIGMGLYIYVSVNPIKTSQEQQAKATAHMAVDLQLVQRDVAEMKSALKEKIHKCETQGAVLETRMTTIEKHNHR